MSRAFDSLLARGAIARDHHDAYALAPGMLLTATLCFAVIAVRLVVVALTPLELDHALQVTLAVLGIIPTAGAIFYSLPGRSRPRMASLYFTVALGPWSAMAFGDLGHVVSYLSKDLPFWDHLLAEGDAILGFDWVAMLAWANERPVLIAVAYGIYMSAAFQSVVIPILLAALGRFRALHVSTVALFVTLIVTYTVACLFPALGTYEYYGIHPTQHPDIAVRVASLHVPEIMGVRDGSIVNISRLAPTGLVTFPSFHAASAVLLAWALWHIPYLRYPGLILNVLMLAATPLHGSHFITDVLAGALTAAVCLWAAASLLDLIQNLTTAEARRLRIGSSPVPTLPPLTPVGSHPK
ncbi:phosphatase PAP2 family protein [Microvirga sp. BT688]|uniref:phosphatase PAP2 family protein n=1 Tax=Microvirga sp. TaxID=1873136 RepID=UPI001684FD42|nr:phosphatase PAP2 family protein [Microvirga sp.]MBD2746145.1 phosphatase PAP2 family protein [Microvirga sp.]